MLCRSSVSFVHATDMVPSQQSLHQSLGSQLWPDKLVPHPHELRYTYDGQVPQHVDEQMAGEQAPVGGDMDEGEDDMEEDDETHDIADFDHDNVLVDQVGHGLDKDDSSDGHHGDEESESEDSYEEGGHVRESHDVPASTSGVIPSETSSPAVLTHSIRLDQTVRSELPPSDLRCLLLSPSQIKLCSLRWSLLFHCFHVLYLRQLKPHGMKSVVRLSPCRLPSSVPALPTLWPQHRLQRRLSH